MLLRNSNVLFDYVSLSLAYQAIHSLLNGYNKYIMLHTKTEKGECIRRFIP